MKKSFSKFTKILPAILLLCFTFSCQKQVEEGITPEEIQNITDHVLEIWNDGNLGVIDHMYAGDYVRRYVDIQEDIVGIDAYKEWITASRTAFPDFRVTLEGEITSKGEMVVSRWVAVGTNTGPLTTPAGVLPPTGKKVRFFGVSIMQVVDGKIAKEWIYYNEASFLVQLGFTITPPAPPPPPEKK